MNHGDYEEILGRPAHKSDVYDQANCDRSRIRNFLALMFIRELPIKNFYARGVLFYVYFQMVIHRGLGRGWYDRLPIIQTSTHNDKRIFANYPDLMIGAFARILPKNPPSANPHLDWRIRQQPTYHQYHRTCYRYRFRKPRYIPWDGTQNQPTMPYLYHEGSGVINGTFFKSTNTNPELLD
jgi:hypothetical protein